MPGSCKATLKRDALTEAQRRMHLRPIPAVTFIADRAPDSRTWCEEASPPALEILNCQHAAQHLKDALKSAYGEGSPEARHRFETFKAVLKDDKRGIDRVIRPLLRLTRKHPGRDTLSRVLSFLRRQRWRLRYAEFQ